MCREQGAKDAAVALVLAFVIGAAALQLGLGSTGRGPASRGAPSASTRA